MTDTLRTGDILLFTGSSYNGPLLSIFSSLISWWTSSPYVHCAFVLKDPIFIHPSLKGIFIWESGWEFNEPDPQDSISKLGVQITPINEYLRNSPTSSVFVRRRQKGDITEKILLDIHKEVYDKPYDVNIMDWLGAAFRTSFTPKQTKRFWCSAFVSYILCRLNFIPNTTNWDLIRPSDLSSTSSIIHFDKNVEYSDDERIF